MKHLALLFLTLQLLQRGTNSSMCKILLRSYYNFKSIDFNNFDSYKLDANNSIYYRLCTNYNETLRNACNASGSSATYGNVVLVSNVPNTACTTVASVERIVFKKIWTVMYSDSSDLAGTNGGGFSRSVESNGLTESVESGLAELDESDLSGSRGSLASIGSLGSPATSGSVITYTVNIDNAYLNSQNILRVGFSLKCNTSLSAANSKFKNQIVNSTLWFGFEGTQACGLALIEPSVFMRNHICFPITLLVLSVLAMIVRRFNERIMMTLFGWLFGVFVMVMAMANLELQFHFQPSDITVLYFCSMFIGAIFGFFCFLFRNSSIILLYLAAAISFCYTALDVVVMISGQGVTSVIFWWTIGILVAVMWILSNVSGFYDKYGHLFLVSIDFPFYFWLSIAVLTGWYPDILTIKKAHEYEIALVPHKENWWFLSGQLIMTLVLFVDSVLIARRTKSEEEPQASERRISDHSQSNPEIHEQSMPS